MTKNKTIIAKDNLDMDDIYVYKSSTKWKYWNITRENSISWNVDLGKNIIQKEMKLTEISEI